MTIFCWLPPESARAGSSGSAGRMSDDRDRRARVGEDARAIERAAMLVRPLAAEDEVVGDRVVEDEPAALAILGDVREPARAALVHGHR